MFCLTFHFGLKIFKLVSFLFSFVSDYDIESKTKGKNWKFHNILYAKYVTCKPKIKLPCLDLIVPRTQYSMRISC